MSRASCLRLTALPTRGAFGGCAVAAVVVCRCTIPWVLIFLLWSMICHSWLEVVISCHKDSTGSKLVLVRLPRVCGACCHILSTAGLQKGNVHVSSMPNRGDHTQFRAGASSKPRTQVETRFSVTACTYRTALSQNRGQCFTSTAWRIDIAAVIDSRLHSACTHRQPKMKPEAVHLD